MDKEFAKQTIKIEGLNDLLNERQKLVEEKSNQIKIIKGNNEQLIFYNEHVKKILTSEQLKIMEEYN